MALNIVELIDDVGDGLPLYLKALRLEIHYLPAALIEANSDDRRDVLREALSGEFQTALRCSSFSGTRSALLIHG